MKLTLAEPKYLKESISIISDMVTEARIKVTPTALELVAMDPANVAMVIFKLLSTSFIEYNVPAEVTLGINLSNLKQVLRRAGPNDTLTLELDKDNKLKILLRGTGTRTFGLPLIEMDEKEQRMPNLTFAASVKLPANLLTNTIADADVVGEAVTFIAEQNKFIVRAEGDLSDANIEHTAGETVSVTIRGEEGAIRAKYSIEYLKKMINGDKLADDVMVHFSKDYPLKLEYTAIDKLSLAFILAPRVEND